MLNLSIEFVARAGAVSRSESSANHVAHLSDDVAIAVDDSLIGWLAREPAQVEDRPVTFPLDHRTLGGEDIVEL